jgi:hypothetical protein
VIYVFANIVVLTELTVIKVIFMKRSKDLLIAFWIHFQMMDPIWPDAQPWDNLLFALAAYSSLF